MKSIYTLLFMATAFQSFGQSQVSLTDIQFTTTGSSSYEGQVVQTIGVVTASAEADNLGYVYIQEEGVTEWGGIPLLGSLELGALKIGDKVAVQGTVFESFGVTTLSGITSLEVVDSNITITPIELNPEHFSSASFFDLEKYAGLFVRLVNGSDSVEVVHSNVGFGDYRIGLDTLTPDQGCNVLAGRQNSSTGSSLNVSYVSDLLYASNDGIMNVPPIEVMNGDAFPWVQGVVTYGFSAYRLLPRNNADFGGTTTGIGDRQLSRILVFPNPSNGEFYVDMSGITAKATMEVFATNGQRMLSKQVTNTDRFIDLSAFDQGVYQLRIIAGDMCYSQRLIVQ